jgi:glycine/D-amino acid oxidase-like deaminating enzyme
MAGIPTAYHILKASDPANLPQVAILEARELCSVTTGRNGGHIKVKTATLADLKEGRDRAEFYNYVLGVIDSIKTIVEQEELVDCEFELRWSFDAFLDDKEALQTKRVYDKAR